MNRLSPLFAVLPIIALVAGCGDQQSADTMEFGRPEVITGLVMELPVTTTSDEARNHFLQGERASDMGRSLDARAHFQRAVAADPMFALAYRRLANTATSLDEFKANLDSAVAHAPHATEAEQLLIRITQEGFEGNTENQLELASQLVELVPTSPRAWQTLAGAQAALNIHEAARASLMKAAALRPDFAPPYAQLGNSYLFNNPKDFAQAEENFKKVIELEPEESLPHDFLGDAYRAQGKLELARDEYTRAAELDPTNGSPLQQRGHVNSFLSDYDAARADYDAAIALETGNAKAAYGMYRTFVSVHAGDPQAAIRELDALVASIDRMDIPEPTGQKIAALTNQAVIALHTGDLEAAEQALERRTALMNDESQRVGTADFRRSQDANIAYWDGMLAARKGDYATARTKADEYTTLVASDRNPRKMEPVHDLMGYVSLLRGNHRDAVQHLEQSFPNDLFTKYHLARAHEEAGNTAEAKRLYGEIADNNFNDVVFALVRQEAAQKR